MRDLSKTTRAGLVAAVVALSGIAVAGEPRLAVEQFGAALLRGDADGLRATLPTAGKVRVRLLRLGPENGALRGGQLHAILQDFLERGSVQSFKLHTIEQTDRQALAAAELELTDAQGARARVRLHLSLEPEDERWVLREIRESSR